MRPETVGRALLGILVLLVVAFLPASCSRGCAEKAPATESRPVAESRQTSGQDPNAENPDRDRWVDLATIPFDPKLVGGRVVQVRSQLMGSMNAVKRENGSADVEKIHKFLLGAPLLMETPDRGAAGIELIPWAAAGMPEDSADHLSQVWTLRPDLTWEDGKPVTAQDYAFTFQLMRNPEVESAVRDSYDAVESIEALDTRRFEVTWKRPNFRAIAAIGVDFQVVPAHAVPADAASFNQTATHLACGPYKIARFDPQGRLELVLRDEYRTKPFPIRPFYIDRYVYEGGVRDATATLTRLVNGEAHIVSLSPDQWASQASEPAFGRAAWRTYYTLTTYSFVVWNLHDPADLKSPHPVLGDVRVRTALSHLLPLDTIAATTFKGLARPISGPFDYRDAGNDPAIRPFAFDPPRAAALFREAGFSPGPDGKLVKDGRPAKITLARDVKAPGSFLVIAQALQEEARKIGVEIDLVQTAKLNTDLDAHRFDGAMLIWWLDPVDADVTQQWHSRYAIKGGFNYPGFRDAETDSLLDRHAATLDAAERAALRRAIHARIHENAPATFLFAHATTIGISKQLANVKVHDLGLRFNDFVLRELWEKHRPR